MDPIRERAALIVLQQARVQRAVDLEEKLEGVLLPSVGQEIERLAKLWDGYEGALQRMGIVRGEGGQFGPAPTVQQTVNFYDVLADQVGSLPDDQRAELAAVLERIRETRARARIAAVDAKVQAMMPDSSTDGDGSGEG